MHLRFAKAGALCAALALVPALSGCVVEERRPATVEILAPRQPPPPRVEIIPTPQRPPDVVEWRPGHWLWDGREYIWVAGEYIERPHHEARWVPGHWDERPNGTWAWIQGHWR
jgi:hypothetical protein